jgi:hypothetical protein
MHISRAVIIGAGAGTCVVVLGLALILTCPAGHGRSPGHQHLPGRVPAAPGLPGSGVGTISAAYFAPELARLAGRRGQPPLGQQ